MLNAAIRNVGTGSEILMEDGIETINVKIKEEESNYGLRIAIPDLLEEEMLQLPSLQQKKESFHLEDEDELFTARCIDMLLVTETAVGYSVELELYESEYGYYTDWLWWDDIVLLYGCKIFVDDDLYCNGAFDEFCGTIVLEPEGNSVKRTEMKPELDLAEYNKAFNKLVKLDPRRYRQVKIRNFRDKIERLQGEIRREEILMERDKLMAELGIDIDEDTWLLFVNRESGGVEDVRYIYNWHMKGYYHGTREKMENVLKLRAKKNRGVNDELADCYESLLADFEQNIDAKLAAQEKAREEFEERMNSQKAEERQELLRKCTLEPAVDNTYYVGAVIDDVLYMNEYYVAETETSDKILITFSASRQESWSPDIDCLEYFLKSVDPSMNIKGMSKTDFFKLLNSDAPEAAELIDKDIPMIYDNPDKYIERLTALGLEVTEETIDDYVQ